MLKTIDWVNQQTREWKGDKGVVVFVSGTFDDGSAWSVGAKPENAQQRMTELQELVGKPGEFELEAGKEYQGRMQWKMKGWPGKPASGGFGGGGGGGGGGRPAYVPDFAKTKEGFDITQHSIHASVALDKAVECKDRFDLSTPEAIVDVARVFMSFLSEPPPQPSPSGEYTNFVNWMAEKVKAGVLTSKDVSWKAAMTYAHELGYDHPKLRSCVDSGVFLKIKDKLVTPPRQQQQNGYGQNAYQPTGAGREDDGLPF